MHDELQNIISEIASVEFGNFIQTIINYLRRSKKANSMAQNSQQFKKEEEANLINFINSNSLWIADIDINCYISEGAEQKVYLKDEFNVLKLNDSIYYESWIDYFVNLLLNNYFFFDTAYD